jgi:hypothetical protein
MRFTSPFVALAASIFLAPSALSPTTAQERVTDIELRAAYCLGVATSQLEDQSAEVASLHAQARAKIIAEEDRLYLPIAEDIQRIIKERRDRFRDYLTAKGFLGGRDIREIRIALLRGPDDAKRCVAENKDAVIAACKRRCGPIDTTEDSERCNVRCSAQACTRVGRCLQQFLPF